jgi:hypothetical protein
MSTAKFNPVAVAGDPSPAYAVSPFPATVITIFEVSDVFTVTTLIDVAVPQLLVYAYLMVSVPPTIPVTTPAVITALLVSLLLHTPPLTELLNVMVNPPQTVDGPVIVPAFGNGFTVITFVVLAVPQLPEMV